MDTTDNQIKNLLSKMGKVNPIRTVARNIAKAIVKNLKVGSEQDVEKALEDAFVRGANWQRMKENKLKLEQEDDSN